MASIHPYRTQQGTRYLVAYTKPDGRDTTKRGFQRQRDAKAFAATVEHSKLQGSYIAPSDARATVRDLGTAWLASHKAAVKPSTFHSDESAWRVHVEPRWGHRPVGSIKHSEVGAWIAQLSDVRSPTTVKRVHGVLAAILDSAVRDRRISTNPAREVKTPRKVSKPRPYLTHRQVERLANASKYPDFVRFLACTGLRWGEAVAIRVKYVDRKRRRVQIEENAVEIKGHFVVGTPKDHERRTVPYRAFLDEAIDAAVIGKDADDLLWPAERGGGYLRAGNRQSGWFTGAVARARAEDRDMPRVSPHDLRHSSASLAISAGASQGRPADARPRQRRDDAGRLRRPLRGRPGLRGRGPEPAARRRSRVTRF